MMEEPSHEKKDEDKLRSEIKEEIKREIQEELKEKKGKSRKSAGVIIAGVGAVLYLLPGFFFLIPALIGASSSYMFNYGITNLIAGGISLAGVIVGMYKVKIGGTITLISIPIAIVVGILLTLGETSYYYYQWIYVLQYVVFPLPIPHSAHVIAGGIICLVATDEETVRKV